MKKNIGTGLALYPTPLVVVGTSKTNYAFIAHNLRIMGADT